MMYSVKAELISQVSSVAASGLQYALGQLDPHGGPAPKRALVNVELRRMVGGGHARVVRIFPRLCRDARVEPEPQVGVGSHEEECPGLERKITETMNFIGPDHDLETPFGRGRRQSPPRPYWVSADPRAARARMSSRRRVPPPRNCRRSRTRGSRPKTWAGSLQFTWNPFPHDMREL